MLSNFNKRLRYEQHYIPALKYFDALVISGEIKAAKPDKEIYEYLLSTYDLIPEECIFIDDNPANIEMANSLGIHGYLFDFDVPKLREYLKAENLIWEIERGDSIAYNNWNFADCLFVDKKTNDEWRFCKFKDINALKLSYENQEEKVSKSIAEWWNRQSEVAM